MRSEKGKRKKAGIYFFSISVHMVVVCMLAFPFLYNDQQKEDLYYGLMVQFENYESKNSKPKTPPTKKNVNPRKKAAETKVLKPKLEKSREKQKTNVSDKRSEKKVDDESQDETHTLTEKRRDFLVKNIHQAELEKQKALEAEKRKAEMEEEAKKEKYEKMKNAFSHLLKNANNETPNNRTSLELYDESLSESEKRTDAGTSENISNRKVIFVPEIKDNSQKEGRVVINICVDASGKVVSAKYTQRGSTTTDSYLIKLAVKNAKLYRFSANTAPRQCGKVNIDFEVR